LRDPEAGPTLTSSGRRGAQVRKAARGKRSVAVGRSAPKRDWPPDNQRRFSLAIAKKTLASTSSSTILTSHFHPGWISKSDAGRKSHRVRDHAAHRRHENPSNTNTDFNGPPDFIAARTHLPPRCHFAGEFATAPTTCGRKASEVCVRRSHASAKVSAIADTSDRP